jgi:hypothetical protein
MLDDFYLSMDVKMKGSFLSNSLKNKPHNIYSHMQLILV